jgi:hypothetical protein
VGEIDEAALVDFLLGEEAVDFRLSLETAPLFVRLSAGT